jgi:hypothetical protein
LQGHELLAFLRQQLESTNGAESIGFGATYSPPHDDEIVVYFGTPDFLGGVVSVLNAVTPSVTTGS